MATIRRDNNLAKTSAAGNLQPSTSYTVKVYPKGAISSGAASFSSPSTTFNVYTGHGFSNNQMVMVGTDTTKTAFVTSTTATTVVVTGNLSASVTTANIVLANLGTDTGTAGNPNFTEASPTIPIYNDYAASSAISGSVVTADANGDYGYYSDAATQKWEVIRNAAGAVQAVLKDTTPLLTGVTSTGSIVDNHVARWDGTSGTSLQSSTVVVDDSGNMSGVVSLSLSGTIATPTQITTSGAVTVGNALTVTAGGATITAGGLTVTAGNVNTGTGTVTMPGAVSATSTVAVTGVSTLTGGVVGPTAAIAANIRTWQPAAASSTGSGFSLTPSTNTLYYGSIFVPCNIATVTGVKFLNDTAPGSSITARAAIWSVSGTLLASTAQGSPVTLTNSANITQTIPFSATVSLTGPAVYFIGIGVSSAAAVFRAIPAACGAGCVGGSVAATYANAYTNITPTTTFTDNVIPVAHIY